jgi:tetratricopeptide (TPR) repeat protein
MKNRSGLSIALLLLALPLAICLAQEQPATQPAQPPSAPRTIADASDAELLESAGQWCAARGYTNAIALVKTVLDRGPEHATPEVLQTLADIAKSVGDMTISNQLDLADLFRRLRRYSDAVSLVGLVVQRDKNNVDAHRLLGEIAWDTQDAERAAKQWDLVRKIQPNDFGANWGLGRLWLHSGVPRQAMGYLETARTVIPADKPELEPEVLIALARAYGGAGDRSRAIEAVKRALELDRRNLDGWYVLTSLHTQTAVTLEDYNEALGDASQLVALADADIKTNGMTPDRLQKLYEACELKLGVLQGQGVLLFERNPDGSASDRLLPGMEQAAARINLAIVDTWMRRADLQRTMQHFRILEFAKAAVQYDGGTQPETLLRLGSLQAATGQYAAATETFQRVLELDPANEPAQQQLEMLLQNQPTSAPSASP